MSLGTIKSGGTLVGTKSESVTKNLSDAQDFISTAKKKLMEKQYKQAQDLIGQASRGLNNSSSKTSAKKLEDIQKKINSFSNDNDKPSIINPKIEEIIKDLETQNKEIKQKQENLSNAERQNNNLVNELGNRINSILNGLNETVKTITTASEEASKIINNKNVEDDGYKTWRATVPFGQDDSREAYEDEQAYQKWKVGINQASFTNGGKKLDIDDSREAYEATKKNLAENDKKETASFTTQKPQTEEEKKKTEEVQKEFRTRSYTINSGVAEIANVGVSVLSTLGKWAESISKAWTTTGAVLATPFTAGYDLITGSNETTNLWNYQMGELEKSPTDELKKDFYTKGAGRTLNNSASSAFKSDGEFISVVSGLTEVGLNIGTSILTGGTVSPITLQSIQTFGKTATKAAKELNKDNESSTGEKVVKLLGDALSNTAWETLQWTIGGEIMQSGVSTAGKTLINAVYNSADTPFRALTDSVFLGKDYGEAFQTEGGWTAMGISGLVGAVSTIAASTKDITPTSKKKTNFEEYSETIGVKSNAQKGTAIKNYVENAKEFAEKGVSFEEYLKENGIDTIRLENGIDAAVELGDSKLYLYTLAKDASNNRGDFSHLSSEDISDIQEHLFNDIGTSTSRLDMSYMEKYLNEEQRSVYESIIANGKADELANSLSETELQAVFGYTKGTGYGINYTLRDGANSTYGVDSLDSIISQVNYDDAIVVYRGTTGIWDGKDQLDVNDLRVGDSFTDAGYQSSSVLFNNNFGARKDDTNIIMEIVIPPNSNAAAYIENLSGTSRYAQMEMLIKRDATMTLIDDVYTKEIDGVVKTIVPVVVQ